MAPQTTCIKMMQNYFKVVHCSVNSDDKLGDHVERWTQYSDKGDTCTGWLTTEYQTFRYCVVKLIRYNTHLTLSQESLVVYYK